MINSLASPRWHILGVVLLGLLCLGLITAEFELVFTSEAVGTDGKRKKFQLEELLTITAVFSVILTTFAFLMGKSAVRERHTRKLIEHAAYLDPLTHLPNRRAFKERLTSALASSRDTGAASALLLIDLDRFKQVNDDLGHAAGDRVLVEVSDRIRSFAEAPEDAARLGGDEFALILRNEAAKEENARSIIDRLQDAISQPVSHDAHVILPGASIGVAFAKEAAARSIDLLEAADRDMYRDKQRRRLRLVA